MTTTDAFSHLPDERLLLEVRRLANCERRATAELIRALMEFDARRLFLGEGYSSLFTYCTQALHLAEGAAYNRIEAARAARRFPIILDALDDGTITLTAVRLLAPHLTAVNHREILAAARYKSKREIEMIVASLNPKAVAPTVIRKVSQRAPAPLPGAVPAAPRIDATARPATAPAPPLISPLAPELYRLQLTMTGAIHAKLRRAQDLLRHSIPSGDPAEILDRALTLLIDDVERRRAGAVASPRPSREPAHGSRHIPAAVRREVWKRDAAQCAFVGAGGRCTERGFLEFHHVEPYAAGGPASVDNLELRCRAHNLYEASLFFGDAGAACVRESAS